MGSVHRLLSRIINRIHETVLHYSLIILKDNINSPFGSINVSFYLVDMFSLIKGKILNT